MKRVDELQIIAEALVKKIEALETEIKVDWEAKNKIYNLLVNENAAYRFTEQFKAFNQAIDKSIESKEAELNRINVELDRCTIELKDLLKEEQGDNTEPQEPEGDERKMRDLETISGENLRFARI